jgi:hypothetical protein
LGASVLSSKGLAAESAGLSCEMVTAQPAAEKALLKQAPKGASRVSPHSIEVKLDSGVKRFVDASDGTHWTYCGYDKANDLHLIGRNDDQTFTGVVLFQKTGKSFVIGQDILVSPDGKTIFGSEQEDGEYGENWAIDSLDGTARWRGYAGAKIKKPGFPDEIVALFEQPRWDAQNNLTAKVDCSPGKSADPAVTLRKTNGVWAWSPPVHCSAQ